MKMIKKKVSELEGAQLDRAVARAHGWHIASGAWCGREPEAPIWTERWMPSTDWSQGGPIIESARIRVRPMRQGPLWFAEVDLPHRFSPSLEGQTPLIAAMRAFVASKLGDEVEVPE